MAVVAAPMSSRPEFDPAKFQALQSLLQGKLDSVSWNQDCYEVSFRAGKDSAHALITLGVDVSGLFWVNGANAADTQSLVPVAEAYARALRFVGKAKLSPKGEDRKVSQAEHDALLLGLSVGLLLPERTKSTGLGRTGGIAASAGQPAGLLGEGKRRAKVRKKKK
jgi:hypothetical protein